VQCTIRLYHFFSLLSSFFLKKFKKMGKYAMEEVLINNLFQVETTCGRKRGYPLSSVQHTNDCFSIYLTPCKKQGCSNHHSHLFMQKSISFYLKLDFIFFFPYIKPRYITYTFIPFCKSFKINKLFKLLGYCGSDFPDCRQAG